MLEILKSMESAGVDPDALCYGMAAQALEQASTPLSTQRPLPPSSTTSISASSDETDGDGTSMLVHDSLDVLVDSERSESFRKEAQRMWKLARAAQEGAVSKDRL